MHRIYTGFVYQICGIFIFSYLTYFKRFTGRRVYVLLLAVNSAVYIGSNYYIHQKNKELVDKLECPSKEELNDYLDFYLEYKINY